MFPNDQKMLAGIPKKLCHVLPSAFRDYTMSASLFIGDVYFNVLVKVVSVTFLHCKITIFPSIVIKYQ